MDKILIQKLENMNKGSNVHIINKTIFYLKQKDFIFEIYLTDLANRSDWVKIKKLLSGHL